MVIGGLDGVIGSFINKIPLIGQQISAVGDVFFIGGAWMYLSVRNLEDDAVCVGETWLRWTDEAAYVYELYNKSWVKYDGDIISKIK